MDLRATASGMHEKTTDMSGLLAEHLAIVRADLWNHFEQIMSLIKQRAEAIQKESSRQLEADIAELRLENRALHDQLKTPLLDPAETRAVVGRETLPSHTASQDAEKHCWLEDVHDLMESTQSAKNLDPSDQSTWRSTDPAAQSAQVTFLTSCTSKSSIEDAEALQAAERSSRRSSNVSHGSSATSLSRLRRSSEQARRGFAKNKSSARSRIFGTKSIRPLASRIFTFDDEDDEDSGRKTETRVGHAVFADAAAMKERVRAAVTKPEYNVSDYYWDSGVCQAVARHEIFEHVTLFVIAFNAVWIWIDVDNNREELLLDADPIFQIAEHSFCIFFTFEWIVRFLAFREKRFGLRDAWFCFDSALLVIMILETWIMTLMFAVFGLGQSGGLGNTSVLKLIRLVRLTRMARMAKLLRVMPELIILIKGIWVAARSVVFTLVLLAIIIYVFAIIFRQLTDRTEVGEQYYKSVPEAMVSLLLDSVLPDQSVVVRDNGDAHVLLGGLQLLFILLSSLTVMNMLVGILCEVVSVVSAVEKEQLTVSYVKQKLQTVMHTGESNGISRVEFAKILENTETASIIQDLGVDVIGLVDFADIIFEEDNLLSFTDFMEVVLQLRGSNHCTVKDMVDFRKFVVSELHAAQKKTVQAIRQLMGATPEVSTIVRSSPIEDAVCKWSETSKNPARLKKSMSHKIKPIMFGSQADAELPGASIS